MQKRIPRINGHRRKSSNSLTRLCVCHMSKINKYSLQTCIELFFTFFLFFPTISKTYKHELHVPTNQNPSLIKQTIKIEGRIFKQLQKSKPFHTNKHSTNPSINAESSKTEKLNHYKHEVKKGKARGSQTYF